MHPVQVRLITAQPAVTKTPPHRRKRHHQRRAKKHPVAKPHNKATHHPKPKVNKAVKHRAKPKARPRPKKKPLDFDPFAPQESVSDAPASARKRHAAPAHPARPLASSHLTAGMTDQEINRYIARIQRKVQNHWKVPAKSPRQLDDPIVLLRLNRDGSIRQITISRPSGDANIDQSLIKAIRAAAPFDLPADHFDIFRINRIKFHPLR